MKKGVILALSFLLILLICVCIVAFFCLSRDLDQATLVGTYVGSYEVFPKITTRLRAGIYKNGTHLLELKSDNTYMYVYNPVDGNSVETVGLWEIKSGYRGCDVVLHDFLLAPSTVSGEKPGVHTFPIQKRFCRPIRLDLGSDIGYYWVKQK